MNKFKTYSKIQALHKEEVDGILVGTCYIQEKIDGANASIWIEDGVFHCGSRSRDLTQQGVGFNGFVDYVNNHEGIKKYLTDNPNKRLYGEWLVRHTVEYNELAYKHFYLFDIEDEDGVFLQTPEVDSIATAYNINKVHLFGEFKNPSLEDIQKLAGISLLGSKGEGVVIKNKDFLNKFGDKSYAKYVTREFKETKIIQYTDATNNSKNRDNEFYYAEKFITPYRVEKIFHKIESSEGRLSMKHTPRILHTVFHDVIQEECWNIAKEMAKNHCVFNFSSFQKICNTKTKKIFIELIESNINANA